MSGVEEDDWDELCGEAYDHEIDNYYEDDDVVQWTCASCGAEVWEDKE